MVRLIPTAIGAVLVLASLTSATLPQCKKTKTPQSWNLKSSPPSEAGFPWDLSLADQKTADKDCLCDGKIIQAGRQYLCYKHNSGLVSVEIGEGLSSPPVFWDGNGPIRIV